MILRNGAVERTVHRGEFRIYAPFPKSPLPVAAMEAAGLFHAMEGQIAIIEFQEPDYDQADVAGGHRPFSFLLTERASCEEESEGTIRIFWGWIDDLELCNVPIPARLFEAILAACFGTNA